MYFHTCNDCKEELEYDLDIGGFIGTTEGNSDILGGYYKGQPICDSCINKRYEIKMALYEKSFETSQ